MKKTIIGIILIGALLFSYQAQGSMGLWKYVSGKLQPVVSTWTLYSPDDFQFDDEIKPDGALCANGEILKKTGADNWDCAADDAGGGSAITFDIGDDGGNDSVDVNEIATTGDTNTIFTEPTADKILIAVGNNWPTADTATTASALVANPTDCGANQFAQSIVASGNLTCSAIGDADVPNNITIDLATLASTVTNATFTTALTVDTGTVGLTGNVANNSVLTLGAGASSLSGANTGDQDLSGYWDADGDIAADEISESKIAFSTACGAGNHYYLNGNDLACEADDAGLTNLTDFDQTAWRLFYSTALGDVVELSLGTDGQYLKSQGGTSTLTWGTPTDTTYTGGTGITLTGTVFSTTDSEIVHDNLSGFVANEHLDWTGDLGAVNIHAGNYTDTNTTYTGGTNLTLAGTTFNVDDAFVINSGSDIIGGGSGFTHTFNASAGSDSVFTFGDGIVNLSTGALQVGGAAVQTGADLVDDAVASCANVNACSLTADAITDNLILLADFAHSQDYGDFTMGVGESFTLDTGVVGDNEIDYANVTLADFDYQTAWRVFYSNTAGDVTELALGADNTYLMSNGAAVAPTFESIAAGGDVTDVFNCATGDCNTLTVGTSEWLTYGTGYIDANRFAGVTTVDATEFGYLNGVTSAIQTQFSNILNGTTAFTDFNGVDILDSDNYNAGSIDAEHLAADIISETKIADNGIDSEHYNDGSIDGVHLAADTITHAYIADSDQTDTKCFYLEDPVAADDLKSIWRNSTANNFLLTEIWGESDQTVSFDLQVDDGTPADVSGTDIAPAAGEAEDTSLTGDTTLAASEELDLIITSVSGTPTWLSVCFTGNWVD